MNSRKLCLLGAFVSISAVATHSVGTFAQERASGQTRITTLDQLRASMSVGTRSATANRNEHPFDDVVWRKPQVEPGDLSARQLIADRDERLTSLRRINLLKRKLKQGADRSATLDELRKSLAEYFLADMRHRLRELDAIRAKVEAMETKLQERLDAQTESIDLQLRLIEQEAQGLGLFRSQTRDAVSSPFGPAMNYKPGTPKHGRRSVDAASLEESADTSAPASSEPR